MFSRFSEKVYDNPVALYDQFAMTILIQVVFIKYEIKNNFVLGINLQILRLYINLRKLLKLAPWGLKYIRDADELLHPYYPPPHQLKLYIPATLKHSTFLFKGY